MAKTKVGVIGCGNISDAYFKTNTKFNFFEIAACADLDLSRAQAKAKQWNIAKACGVEELLSDKEISFVIDLTIPKAHGPVNLACIKAGKSVYTEKPFAVTREEAHEVIALARQKNLRVGSAPDTFLGGGQQTVRKLIDDGAIGKPIAAVAFMTCHGHESWHPSPAFYYQKGGGPMLDMGPYYLTDLVQLMGPVKRVAGVAKATFPTRTITSQPLNGTVINVEVPTHVSGSFEFASGAVGTLVMSFDVFGGTLPRIEIYGTEGTLYVPDPNTFGGPVKIQRGKEKPEDVALTHGYVENSRGIGMADMILAMQNNRDHRCNERVAYHVLDVMQAFHESSERNAFINIQSTCERPAPMKAGLKDGELE